MELILAQPATLIYTYSMGQDEHAKNIDFAALCKSIRADLGITQKEMAKKLGVTLRGYQKYEAGEVKPAAEASFLLAVMDMERKFQSVIKGIKDSAEKPSED